MGFDLKGLEEKIAKFWEENSIYSKVKKKADKSKTRFKFLDGPPYANGEIHLGHAWNKTLKDMILRYKRMRGYAVHDQPGFDTHGLPIEIQVEKTLGIKNKEEIKQKIGAEEFIKKCKEFAIKNMKQMTLDFKRLGVWQDWDNPYFTFKNEYIEGAWYALKKAYEDGILYKGKKVLTWCPRCATALAKSELEYETVKETSIFVKFPIKGEENSYLVIWTTTPWTIPLNMAVMVHPEFDYVKIETEDGEKMIFAKALVGAIMGLLGKKFKVIEEFKGEDLKGLEYEHPLKEEVPKQKEFKHFVVLSDQYVSLDAGSGLVHCAPGCGPEDYLIGLKNNIPIFSPITEDGHYEDEAGKYKGMFTKSKETEEVILSDLRKHNLLLLTTPVEHEYPHCWRCHSPVIFRATEQWFLGVSKLRDKLLEENKKVKWNPSWGGKWFENWLQNLEDWCISRQRYWGTPLPIWTCECGHVEVIGSIQELKKKATTKFKDLDLHIPDIDKIKIKCEKCGKEMSRIPDVLDVWLDSGVAPWASLDYPSDKKRFKQNFPQDLILEGKDQIRGWFNSLMAMSYLVNGRGPYEQVLMHGFITDEKGRRMSKSLGNGVSPGEVIEKYGAETLRSYLVGASPNGEDVKFVWKEVLEVYKLFGIILNTFKFIKQNMELENYEHSSLKAEKPEDKWIVSRVNSFVEEVTDSYENLDFYKVPNLLNNFLVEDLSRTYLKLVKDRLYSDDEDDKKKVLLVLDYVASKVIRVMATVHPFIAEKLYQDLKGYMNLTQESVHMLDWPDVDSKLINTTLENQMKVAKDVMSLILNAREKAGIGVRWPLGRALVVGDDFTMEAVKQFNDLILGQTNVKALVFSKQEPDFIRKERVLDYEKLEKKYGKDLAIITRRILELSPEYISRELEKGQLIIKEGDKEFILKPEDFVYKEVLPEEWVGAEDKGIKVYLNKELTRGLLAEGYAREIIRRIQDMRKELKLNKNQMVKVTLMNLGDLRDDLEDYLEYIQKRTSSEVMISDLHTKGDLYKEFKIRDKNIAIAINVGV